MINFDELPSFKKLCKMLKKKYGEPIGEGRHRLVFHDKENDEVIKVPTRLSGISANQHEIDWQGEIYAKTKVDEWASEILGEVVIRMEYVSRIPYREQPDWASYIDCGQVGQTSDGRIVAYDWDHY